MWKTGASSIIVMYANFVLVDYVWNFLHQFQFLKIIFKSSIFAFGKKYSGKRLFPPPPTTPINAGTPWICFS